MSAATRELIANPLYARILSKFPQNFAFCFAYGSAVKPQDVAGPPRANMVDLIYCVDDAEAWHRANVAANRSHYSALRFLGERFLAKFQENVGARLYYNTLVPIDGVLVKYGVVSTRDLVTDLLEWSDLYLAGRLHKPVEVVRAAASAELRTALQLNLQSAVHAALLVLPDSFTEYEFYHAIAGLSYAGDFRMTFGENRDKVANIVRPQVDEFRALYRPFVAGLADYVDFPAEGGGARCAQDVNALARLHHLNQLPRWPQKALTRFWNQGKLRQDTEDVLRAIAYDPDCNAIVQRCINDIVYRSSVTQSLKGILTAGVVKSVKYGSLKVVKMMT